MSQYRIKTVSKITNIPVDTIRNWEKRYSFLKPEIGKNGERFYSDTDIELLRKITALLKMGGRISEVASRILDGENIIELEMIGNKISNEVMLMIEEYYQCLLSSDLKKIDQIEGLIEITVVFKNRIEFIYYPLIERARHDCAKKIITLAQEHFVTGHIINKLKGFLSSSVFNYDSKNCSIICATPSNAIYEGGLLVLACSMKLKGHNIFYLGPNLPIAELKHFAEKFQPSVVAISIYNPDELTQIVKNFEKSTYPVCVGGLGVRLADSPDNKIGSIHLISQSGTTAMDKLESISHEYLLEYKKNNQ